jgi:hypothetical protein
MKKARSKVVGEKSPEKSSASIALREALGGLTTKGAAQQIHEGLRQRALLACRARDARGREGVERVSPVGSLARQRLEQDEAESVHVGACIPRLAGDLLGREVAPLLDREKIRAAQGRPEAQARQLHFSVEHHDDPGGRNEAVKETGAPFDFLAVQELECDRRPARDHQRVVGSEREGLAAAAIEDGGDRATFHQLGGDVHGLLHPADAEHAYEARVLEPRREARLVHQPLRGLGIRGNSGPESQDGDQAIQAGGAQPSRAILAPESARACFLDKDELAELLPQGHGIAF